MLRYKIGKINESKNEIPKEQCSKKHVNNNLNYVGKYINKYAGT
jgi:hypothetical protein